MDTADNRPTPGALLGHRAIAAYLSDRLGVPVSVDGVYRLSIRKNDPLPLAGYTGRAWAFPAMLDDWIARQTRSPRRARK